MAAVVGALLARRLSRPVERLRQWARDDRARRRRTARPRRPASARSTSSAPRSTDAGARIRELLRRERSFSSHVSHQLRTPVAAMRVAIETELAAPRDDRTEVLDESLRALDRLESTIESMLALARHDERTPAWCDVGGLVRDHAERWRPSYAAAGRDMSLERARPAGRDRRRGRRSHPRRAVRERPRARARPGRRDGAPRAARPIEIDVGDEGPSNAAADPFSDGRVDTSHGIGLRLARTLAESEGGQLRLLEVAPTVFRLSLPAPDPRT